VQSLDAVLNGTYGDWSGLAVDLIGFGFWCPVFFSLQK